MCLPTQYHNLLPKLLNLKQQKNTMPYIADIIILFNIMIHVGLIQVLVVATL